MALSDNFIYYEKHNKKHQEVKKMNIWKRIDKKERIEKWIDWCDIPIIIEQPEWWDDKQWRGNYCPNKKEIRINGNQNDKEIIKSIIHEIGHWKNNDQIDDPDIWEREDRCIRIEKQWKEEPENINWNP